MSFSFDTFCPMRELPGDANFSSEVLLDSGKYLGESWQHFVNFDLKECDDSTLRET